MLPPPDASGPLGGPLVTNVERCHELGWSFTPLDGKKPILAGWQKRPRETRGQAVQWAQRGNVGLRTGSVSGVVAIDLDEYKDDYDAAAVETLDLPPTVTIRTGGGGTCRLYMLAGPLGNSAGKLAPAVDVKADGGQVVFAGSTHPDSGKLYEWEPGCAPWEIDLADLPQVVYDRLAAPKPPRRPPPSLPPSPPTLAHVGRPADEAVRYATRALQFELNAVCRAEPGRRNHTLNKAAFSLGQLVAVGHLDRAEVEASLASAAASAGLEADEIDKTIRSGIDSGMRQPRKLPVIAAGSSGSEAKHANHVPDLPPHRFKLDLFWRSNLPTSSCVYRNGGIRGVV